MEKWKNKFIDGGTIKPRTKKIFLFEALKNFNILRMESSCGCTSPLFDKSALILKVTYKGGSVPHHLTQAIVRQNITVYYENGSKDVLGFKLIIK